MEKTVVAIKCLVYNHGLYLRQCLDGFVMQKTNFPFIAIVHDDASTDNSVEIIKEYADKYPKIIKPIYEIENQYSKMNGSLRRVMEQAINATDCEYIAMCEGDDYWTDPYKLQKQVEFLSNNPEYGLVHTEYNVVNASNHNIQRRKRHNLTDDQENVTRSLLLYEYGIGSATVLYRRHLLEKIPKHYLKLQLMMGDLPLWIEIAHISKIHFMNDATACYRILEESASHSNNLQKEIDFLINGLYCRKEYAKIYNIDISDEQFEVMYVSNLIRLLYDRNASRQVCKSYIDKISPKIINKIPLKYKFFYLATQSHLIRSLITISYKFM